MDNKNRLVLIRTNENFTNCKCCGFTYIPMTLEASKKCPKREGMKVSDQVYLDSEMRGIEEVNSDYLFDDLPSRRELG